MKIFLKHNKQSLKNNKGFTPTPINIGVSSQGERGFTLVELLVVFFIMASILAVVIPGYLEYSTKIELQNLALDVALTVREAQVYGAGARVTSGGSFTTGYGVHFVKGASSFIVFENKSNGSNNLNVYSSPGDIVINTYTIKNGYSVSDLCHPHPSLPQTVCGDTALDIVFNRPNPDASIKYATSGSTVSGFAGQQSYGIIILMSPDQATTSVTIESVGNISVLSQ